MQQNKTLKNVKLYADDRKVKYVVVRRFRDLDTSREVSEIVLCLWKGMR